MANQINLSYITATKNKLPYLKKGLEKVITQKKPDEEILIADGGSTDGTREYLEGLKKEGKIDYFISESDFGESHALNKLFLIVKGTLVKIINDDDAYYFPAIQRCKEFMLAHPEADILGMEGGSFKHLTPSTIDILWVAGYEKNYRKWQVDHTPFEFAVLGIMFRRTSLPILGFWNLSFTSADTEYTFRVTAGKGNVAWYTGPAFVYIKNQDGVTWVRRDRLKKELSRLRKFYLDENPPSQIKEFLIKTKTTLKRASTFWKNVPAQSFPTPWAELHAQSEKWLEEKNRDQNGQIKTFDFIWKK
jgi:glycosyltransferase involved in cell wall biosynthesis